MTPCEKVPDVCAAILTNPAAAQEDRAACRRWLDYPQSETTWPEAFIWATLFIALAWAASKVVRELG